INSTVNEIDYSDNFACKNITVVENPIQILTAPSLTNFGSFNFLQVKLNSTYYSYDKIRFLVYGGYGKSGSRIVADLSWNKITKYADCSGDLSVEAKLEDNRTYYFSIPFFIYPNCNNYYSPSDYMVTLRTCSPSGEGYKKYIEFPLNLSITGKNERLCPTPEIRTVYKEKNITTRPIETFHKTYEIISAPDQVRVGEGFQVIVRIENVDNITKNFTAYSYVYSGRKIISEGFTGSRWLKSWTANQREITLVAGNSTILTLLNRIRLDAEPGEYILKVRIKDEEDLVKNITILPILPKVEANLTCEVRNDTLVAIIKNGQLPANFTLVEIQESLERKVINLNESEEVRLSFNLTTKTHLLLLHDERIISNCTAEKPKVKEKPEQQPITGHAVERPNPIFVVLQAIYNWLKSLFFKS
ncbi:MAG: hypothetical protein QMD14_03855, partial [Candidatus Aenigmarchaeota archaeon]|nr:hypothetical protein [Candidatus Aenigmarchaeota archaeon]